MVLDATGEAYLLQLINTDNDNTNGTTHEKDGWPSLTSIEVDNLVIDIDTQEADLLDLENTKDYQRCLKPMNVNGDYTAFGTNLTGTLPLEAKHTLDAADVADLNKNLIIK